MSLAMSVGARPLLDDVRYRRFLADTHPELRFDDERLDLPSYIAPLDVREPMLPGPLREMVRMGAPLSPVALKPRSLFLGSPFERYDQTQLLDDVRAPEALAEQARAVAEGEGLELVVLTCVAPDHERMGRWVEAGFRALPSFPDTVLPLVAPTFDGQLRSLPPGDRSGIRRNVRRFERAGHRLERLSSSREEADALWRAYLPMYERATVKWLPHTRDYFARVAELDEQVHLTVARNDDDEVIGFVINFEDLLGDDHQRRFHAGRIGVDPRYHKKDAVYFRLMYHVVEESIARGGTHLSLEPTGYRMKRHLGARRRQLVNLVMGVSPSWRLTLSTLAPVGRALLRHLDDKGKLERIY
jgi:hypothetical protein